LSARNNTGRNAAKGHRRERERKERERERERTYSRYFGRQACSLLISLSLSFSSLSLFLERATTSIDLRGTPGHTTGAAGSEVADDRRRRCS